MENRWDQFNKYSLLWKNANGRSVVSQWEGVDENCCYKDEVEEGEVDRRSLIKDLNVCLLREVGERLLGRALPDGERDERSKVGNEAGLISEPIPQKLVSKHIGRIVHAPTRFKQCGHPSSSVYVEERMKATAPTCYCKPMAVPLPHSSCVRRKKSCIVEAISSIVSLIMLSSYVCTVLLVKTAEKHVDYRRKMARDFGSSGLVRAGVG